MPVTTRSEGRASSPPRSASDEHLTESQQERAAFRFLDLPPEIRDQIYEELVASDLSRQVDNEGVASYKFHLNIYRTCKQVYREASAAFRLHNVIICVETPWQQAEQHVAQEGFIHLLAVGEKSKSFAPYHLHAVVEVPEMNSYADSSFVMLVQDLDAFCQMWFYSNLTHSGLNSHLTLNLKLARARQKGQGIEAADAADVTSTNPLPQTLQRKLLAPFERVKDIKRLNFVNASPDIESSVRSGMAEPNATPEQCLDECARLKELGNKAVRANRAAEALALYISAFHAMHIVVVGRRRNIHADAFFEKDLVGGTHNGQFGGIVRMTLRVRLVANIMLALLQLERWADVHFWGTRSINLMRDALGSAADEPRDNFPAPESWGKIYYRTSVACRALGDVDGAKDFLKIAAAWLPNDPIVREELGKVAPRLG